MKTLVITSDTAIIAAARHLRGVGGGGGGGGGETNPKFL